MRLRVFQTLVIVLSLAAALPPPRVTNALIAAGTQEQSSNGKKPIQARARNRIGTPIQIEVCPSLSPLASGKKPLRRPLRFARHQSDSKSSRLLTSRSPSPALPHLHLRC
jgi:hypothetical protein